MSDIPGEAYVHRYSSFLKKLLAAKGGEPIHELATELVPGITITQGPIDQSLNFLQDIADWFATVTAAASVGNFSHAGFRNRAGSGFVSVVERVIVTNLAAAVQTVDFRVGTPVYAGALVSDQNTVTRDLRVPGTPGTRIITFTNAAEQQTNVGTLDVPPNQSVQVPVQVTLGANSELLVVPEVANLALNIWGIGHERPVETSERA